MTLWRPIAPGPARTKEVALNDQIARLGEFDREEREPRWAQVATDAVMPRSIMLEKASAAKAGLCTARLWATAHSPVGSARPRGVPVASWTTPRSFS
jgi:hypothetical protein